MNVNGISVEVLRKNNKNMHLYVLPPLGKVRVSAPLKIADETIRLFVLTKLGWVKSKIREFENQPRQTIREYVSGESHYFWGNRYLLKVIENAKENGVSAQSGYLVLRLRKGSNSADRKTIFNEWYRKELKQKIPALIALWQKRLGVIANDWQVKNMRTKWGTCNVSKKRVWINLQLAKKPIECLEYIIVHELCHLIQKDHSAAFIALMDKHLPNWRVTQRTLNEFIIDAYDGAFEKSKIAA
ncbi:MAG: M48 family metallopeptidase [Helicobacteraceae bacterium]|jgi:predicted metal-dependent hydrolase|nr:M48 family metallopeptidase [Helicobacteraceae bacterium]